MTENALKVTGKETKLTKFYEINYFFCHFRESDESFGLTQQIFRGVLYAIFLIYLFVGISGATTKSQRNRVRVEVKDTLAH